MVHLCLDAADALVAVAGRTSYAVAVAPLRWYEVVVVVLSFAFLQCLLLPVWGFVLIGSPLCPFQSADALIVAAGQSSSARAAAAAVGHLV